MEERTMRWNLRTVAAVALWLVPALIPAAAIAGRGAGELSLDRSAVAALVDAGMPRAVPLSLPGLGDLTLELHPPRHIAFVDGGVEGRLSVRLAGLRYETGVHVRYIPEIDRRTGVIRLQPVQAEPERLPPMPLDLAPLLPAIPLPRGSAWSLPGIAERTLQVQLHVQGLSVEDDRLVIEFGLMTGAR
jgi:hypothetical protein